VARRGGVATSAEEDAASARGKGGDDASWADTNLTWPKMKKKLAIDSIATNGQ
jgi:hypothetical protein